MHLKIRLAMHGLRNRRIFHIVAIDSKKPRNARPLEKLGVYDPTPKIPNTNAIPMPNRIFGTETKPTPMEKKIEWDPARIKWWLGQGAQPTQTVIELFEKGGLLEPGHPWDRRRQMREKKKEVRAAVREEKRARAAELEAQRIARKTAAEEASGNTAGKTPSTVST